MDMVSNFKAGTHDPTRGTNTIQANPLMDAQYHLTVGSPAINTGAVVPVPIDIDGDQRPNGAFDIGADEFFYKIYLALIAK